MSPTRRLIAVLAAATGLAVPAVAGAGAVSATLDLRFTVLATCSVQAGVGVQGVQVDCPSSTPYQLSRASAPASAQAPSAAQPAPVASADGQRWTVYF